MSTDDPRYTIHAGDVRQVLRSLPAESVHCCVTSPPYFSLRDYGTAQWAGGDAACEHREPGTDRGPRSELPKPPAGWAERAQGQPYKHTCGRCGALRQDHQLGLEATVGEYISNMVAVFEDVRRVLRSDGLCFVNIGDSYAGSGKAAGDTRTFNKGALSARGVNPYCVPPGLKAKDLCLIPQRLAIALQDAGWWVRSIIIWDKPNPMPESVDSRPTTSHEYVLMLAKSANYYYDSEAIREPGVEHAGLAGTFGRNGGKNTDYSIPGQQFLSHRPERDDRVPAGRNKRTVWRIPSHSFEGAHFATFPPALVEPMIKAATSQAGCCPSCGTPWRRTVETVRPERTRGHGKYGSGEHGQPPQADSLPRALRTDPSKSGFGSTNSTTTGWTATCKCSTDAPLVPATVLDCFSGASTTGVVALRLGRKYLGIELNPLYVEMSHKRIAEDEMANQMHMRLEAMG